MNETQPTAFAEWEEGNLTDLAALRAIWSDLREVEDQIAVLNEQRDAIREQLSRIIAKTGTVVLAGFGKATLTAPTRVVSYDSKKLGFLCQELRSSYPEVAQRIEATQKVSERAGGLRIEKER
jgi:hypothetical protein